MTENKGTGKNVDIRTQVRDHYGSIASEFEATGGAGCCGPDESSCGCSPSTGVNDIDMVSKIYENPDVESLPDDVTGLSLGCGDPVTLASLEPGQTVLDLGSGGGIDCFLSGKRVGETGRVIGIDMTSEMIEKARANKDNLGAENVEFRLGEIEHLPVANETADVVISNCVINLSPDKPQVFREAFRALRPGGRLAVSDIVTDGPLPDEIKSNLSAWAGCIGGALEVSDYIAAIEAAGFVDVELTPVYLDESVIEAAMERLDPDERIAVGDDSTRVALAMKGGEAKPYNFGDDQGPSSESIRQAVFSAKVTARKPNSQADNE
ncbi:MAG: arsenite methyltransferase [Anaerolineales bacterium]|nr:arsenite methyltransferase [Anaerolineales bacterium]